SSNAIAVTQSNVFKSTAKPRRARSLVWFVAGATTGAAPHRKPQKNLRELQGFAVEVKRPLAFDFGRMGRFGCVSPLNTAGRPCVLPLHAISSDRCGGAMDPGGRRSLAWALARRAGLRRGGRGVATRGRRAACALPSLA